MHGSMSDRSLTSTPVLDALMRVASELDGPRKRDPSGHGRHSSILASALFQQHLRFGDYQDDADYKPYSVRLLEWLKNVEDSKSRRAMFQVLERLEYIDSNQFRALNQFAFRDAIVRWLWPTPPPPEVLFTKAFFSATAARLRKHALLCITVSFSPQQFSIDNRLSLRPSVLPKKLANIVTEISDRDPNVEGFIVMEDFVGSGAQSLPVLEAVLATAKEPKPVLFIPLIAAEAGVEMLRSSLGAYRPRLTIEPVLTIPSSCSVGRTARAGEPREMSAIRRLVISTAPAVLGRSKVDRGNAEEFGYRDMGMIFVSTRNTPDDTLPLIHHRGKSWNPLFPRLSSVKA